MPGLGGHAVLAGMRSRRQTSDLPVVILSGDEKPPDLRKLQGQGALEWLQKPVNFDSLVKVAHHYLRPR